MQNALRRISKVATFRNDIYIHENCNESHTVYCSAFNYNNKSKIEILKSTYFENAVVFN